MINTVNISQRSEEMMKSGQRKEGAITSFHGLVLLDLSQEFSLHIVVLWNDSKLEEVKGKRRQSLTYIQYISLHTDTQTHTHA